MQEPSVMIVVVHATNLPVTVMRLVLFLLCDTGGWMRMLSPFTYRVYWTVTWFSGNVTCEAILLFTAIDNRDQLMFSRNAMR